MPSILTVFGATGRQGGSVIKHVLAHPELSKTYTIRAVTRDPSKPSAQALQSQGCQIVQADLSDKTSVVDAVAGSSAVFAVTDFWTSMSAETEITQGKNIADASQLAGVNHLIWSSLVDVSKASDGRLTSVKHFDSKAVVENYIRQLDIPASFFLPGGFMSDFWKLFQPDGDDKNTWAVEVPFCTESTKIPLIEAASNTGNYVAAMLLEGPSGNRVAASAEYHSPADMASIYKSATGRNAVARQIDGDAFSSRLPEVIREEITGNMALMTNEFGYYLGEPLDAVTQGHRLLGKHGIGQPMSFSEFAMNRAEEEKAEA